MPVGSVVQSLVRPMAGCVGRCDRPSRGIDSAIRALFANGEQGAWFDPSEFDSYAMERGPEIVANGDFSQGFASWDIPASWVIDGAGGARKVAGTAETLAQKRMAFVGGATYEIVVRVRDHAAGSIAPRLSGFGVTVSGASVIGNGLHRWVMVAPFGATTLGFPTGASTALVIESVSVREMSGLSRASMFQDAAGSIPVTRLGDPVGMILDKRFGLERGPELFFGDSQLRSLQNSAGGAEVLLEGRTVRVIAPGTNTGYPRLNVNLGLRVGAWYECRVIRSGPTPESLVRLATSNTTSALAYLGDGVHAGIVRAESDVMNLLFNGTVVGDHVIESVSVRELPGNHAVQPTATARPTLQARVNLLRDTESFSASRWLKTPAGTALPAEVTDNFGIAPDGTKTAHRVRLSLNGGTSLGDHAALTQIPQWQPGRPYVTSVWLKSNDGRTVDVLLDHNGTATFKVTVTPEWQRFAANLSILDVASRAVNIVRLRGTFGTADSVDLLVWHPQVEDGTEATPYQRVASETDYADIGRPRYLQFDGIDDELLFAQSGYSQSLYIAAVAMRTGPKAENTSIIGGPNHPDGSLYFRSAPTNPYGFNAFGDSGAFSPAAPAEPIRPVVLEGAARAAASRVLAVDGAVVAQGPSKDVPVLPATWAMGARSGSAINRLTGRFYGAVVRMDAPTEPAGMVARYLMRKAGVTP